MGGVFHEYDLVRLREPMRSLSLSTGTIGTIVMVHDDGRAYEVEFVDDKGNTGALLTLEEDALIRVYRTNLP